MPFINLKDLTGNKIVAGYIAKFIHTENMTVSYWEIDADNELPEHSHPNEQISIMIEGEFVLKIDGEERKVIPGMVSVIPSNSKHSGKSLTECRIMDIFYPVREDYKQLEKSK